MALGRRVVSDAARTEPPLGLGASSGIRRDECDHNPRLAWSRKPVRQVAKSHYSKAWEPGEWSIAVAPVRLLLSARCAADRTGRIMIAILTELTLYGYIGAHPGCVVAQMVAIDASCIDAVNYDTRDSRDPFAMGTRRWRPLRAQTRLSGRAGNAECRSERSIPRRAACIATCVDFILIPFSFALNP